WRPETPGMQGRMDHSDETEDCYLPERLRRAFATDPRLNELELEVEIRDGVIVVAGAVQTHGRKEAVSAIARAAPPDRPRHNRIRVLPHGPGGAGRAVP